MKKVKDAVREGYKQTELGEIPVEWEVKKLGEVAEIIMGQSPDSKYYNEEGKGVPFFQGKTEFGEIYPIVKKWCTNPTKISKFNDVLVSVRAPVGDVNINNIKEACIGRGLAAIRQTKKSHYEYLFYVLKVNKSNLEKISQGSTFTAISSSDLQNLLISLPPLPEQKKIAEILSTVDEQIEQTEQLIEKTKELKKGLMQKLLTKGIGHKRFKKTEVGEIPEEWEVVELGKYVKVIGGFAFKSKFFEDKGIKILRISNISEGKIVFNDCVYYPDNKIQGLSDEFILNENDVVIAMSGATTGKVGIVKKQDLPCLLNQRVGKFKPLFPNKIDNTFLYYVVNTQYFQDKIWDFAFGGAQPNISGKQIESILITVPSFNEQKLISHILLAIDERIEHYESRKQQLQQLKKGLMQKLLTGKIRVKV